VQIFAFISFGFFVAVSLVVGFRLLRLAWRTRLAPELAIGAQIFFMGGIGYAAWILGSSEAVPQTLTVPVRAVAALCLSFGSAALYIGSWRIFRPSEAWAGVLAVLGAAVLLGTGIYDAANTETMASQITTRFLPSNLAMIGCFAWMSFESFGHFRMMQRRHRIGLAEPALANRFLLWGMAGAAAALVVTGTTVNWFVFPRGTVGAPIVLMQSILGLVGAVLIWLTFYPPRALEGLLLQRSEAGGSSDG
jgi:hypothetical protein